MHLDAAATAGTEIGGSGNLTASGCQIYDDSNDTSAIDARGSIMAAKVGVTGGSSGSVSPTPITGMTPVSDPLCIAGGADDSHGNLAAPRPTRHATRTNPGFRRS